MCSPIDSIVHVVPIKIMKNMCGNIKHKIAIASIYIK